MDKKKILTIGLAVLIYILATGFSYFLFSRNVSSQNIASPVPVPTVGANGQTQFSNSLPKTQACPLNGELYSTQQEQWWQQHRPLGVMVENSVPARPQSGLSGADVVYEAVAEGGITRFLAVFYCQDAGEVGPVRSARTYFVDFISEYGNYPLYAHVGGANTPGPADALGQIDTYGWTNYNDLNQFSIGFPTYWRDYTRNGTTASTEHTMFSTVDKLWAVGASRGLTNVSKDGTPWTKGFVPYAFKSDAPASARPTSQTIHIEFWPGSSDYYVDWTYNPQTNLYGRVNGGVVSKGRDTGKQLMAKDVIVLYMRESHAIDGYMDNEHLLYGDKGTGNALVFMDGKEIKATWEKDSRTSRTILSDQNGNQIKFDRGLMWFEIVPTYETVTVK